MGGPVPLPTQLKILKGVKPYRINQNEPKPKIAKATIPRGWALNMSKSAINFWKHTAPKLVKSNLLTEIDLEAFREMCEVYAMMVKCKSIIRKHGLTYTVEYNNGGHDERPRPEVGMLLKLGPQFARHCQRFGMTPADRTSINMGKGDVEEPNYLD